MNAIIITAAALAIMQSREPAAESREAPTYFGPDINGDRIVDGADYGLVLGGWGKVTGDNFAADVNRDGTVNGADLGLVLGAWGSVVVRNDYGDGADYLIPADHDADPSPVGPGWTRYAWGWTTTPTGRRERAFAVHMRESDG